MTRIVSDSFAFLKRRVFLISWISLVIYLFYNCFIFYKNGRQFFYLRRMLGIGLCVSRGTATVLNLCCALVLLPLCKKLNQILYRVLSKVWPSLFFFWLERAKSFHMTVACTLVLFAVLHSISHFVNLWNFSRSYDEQRAEINLANYKNESPFLLLMSVAGVTGTLMLLISLSMGLTSMRVVRRRIYNAFWYTHQLYLPFMVLLMIHPLSGALKEEVLDDSYVYYNSSQIEYGVNGSTQYSPKFVPIKSKTWLWMAVPLSCFFVDLLWRVFSRNRAAVHILNVTHMPGRTLSVTLSCPHEQFSCRRGQYILMQCSDVSVLEWHPFTVVKVPTCTQRDFVIWIKVKGDWTEAFENLLTDKGYHKLSVLIDGPFSSPMEGASRNEVSICVAAGVGITPFIAMLHDIYRNPRSRLPGRIHLLWIVRNEQEITWLADLAHRTIAELRHANRPDRLHLEFYVTNSKENDPKRIDKEQNALTHMVVVDEKGDLTHILTRDKINDDEKMTLLTPHMKRNAYVDSTRIDKTEDNNCDIIRNYPLVGCRLRRGRPHWDRVFGYWVHLYPGQNLNLYCCGPKKLVKLLRGKCKYTSSTTKTKLTFIHEAFS
ncbi:NADPH oxidase 4-like [Epargyreus clarus]|uniref:NADPH oxidase 4-like n=1 Tax=Epargyreus clarus TaxID=520877 RepID=UPI003C2C7FB8